MQSWSLLSRSAAESSALGRLLGELLSAGQVVWLSGDLGSGKTCLARGLARGLGVPEGEAVTSPTYTLMNEYPARHRLRHFDLYRLGGAGDLEDIGFYEALAADGVSVVEWAERAEADAAPGLHVTLAHVETEDCRQLVFRAVGTAAERLLADLARRWAEPREGA